MKHKGSSTSCKKKSLCEKSMILVANIIKLSSLSLGNINLGTTRIKIQQPPEPAAARAKVTEVDVPGHHSSRSQPKRSQEPENESKPFSLVMQVPSTNQNTSTAAAAATAASTSTQSSYVSEKSKRDTGGDVNQRAADFIEKMRAKIQKNQDDQLVVNLTPGTTTAGIVSSKHTSRALFAPAPKISKRHYYS